jgi:ubiquinol oxidase
MEATGPVSSRLVDRAPFGPMEPINHERLLAEHQASVESPRRRPGLSARVLFLVMDVVYGKPRTLEKFRVLELVARVPIRPGRTWPTWR